MKRTHLALVLSALSFTALGAVAHAEPPQGGPPPGGRGPRKPPQEAFDACKSQKEGDACNVTFHEHTIEGTCEAFGDEGLACRPSGPPPGPPPGE